LFCAHAIEILQTKIQPLSTKAVEVIEFGVYSYVVPVFEGFLLLLGNEGVWGPEMCWAWRGPAGGRRRVRKLFERPRTDADATLSSVADAARLTEFVYCTYAMNANEAVIFEFLVIVLTRRETPLMCLLLLIFCTGNGNVNWW